MTGDAGLPEPARRGRTRVTTRALDRVVCAVAARELGSDRRDIDADIDDAGGDLSLRVRTRLRIPALGLIADDPSLIGRGGGTVLDRMTAAQAAIRSGVAELTGSSVARVVVEVTGAEVAEHRRVR